MTESSRVSPMLRHALESLGHGLQHYLDGTDLGRKMALLHVDHSVELMLKEKVVRTGQSIYKSDGKTISIYEAHSALKGISIPEWPRLEELRDFRNVVQHRGLTPDALTTAFFVHIAYDFTSRFLPEELGTSLDSALPNAYIGAMRHEKSGAERDATNDIRHRLVLAEQLFRRGIRYGRDRLLCGF